MTYKNCLILLSVALGFSTVSCSEKIADKVGDAQRCLDEYTSKGTGDIETCVSKIEGVTGPSAENIRCAAGYLREGFTAQTFIDAFEEIETVNATNVLNFLNRMTFQSAGTAGTGPIAQNLDNAETTYGHCANSLGKSATVLATFTYLVNSLYNYECDGGSGNCILNDATTLGLGLAGAILDNTAGGNAYKTELGTIVVSTHKVSCSGAEANETLCDFLQRAIDNAGGPSNTRDVGQEFLEVLVSP